MTLCDYNLVKGEGHHSPVAPMGSKGHPQMHIIQSWIDVVLGPLIVSRSVGGSLVSSCPAGSKSACLVTQS